MRTITSIAVLLLLVFLQADAAVPAESPVAVSPGALTGLPVLGDSCPTFSWGAIPEAESYELAVYRLSPADGLETAAPILERRIAGRALSWTPSLEECLEPGEAYAWTVRARLAESLSPWSEPVSFRISSSPSRLEVERALETLQRYMQSDSGAADHSTGVHGGLPALLDTGIEPVGRPSRGGIRPPRQ